MCLQTINGERKKTLNSYLVNISSFIIEIYEVENYFCHMKPSVECVESVCAIQCPIETGCL